MTLATSPATQTETQQVVLTEAAARAVQDLFAKRNLEGYALRLFISGGGCSGYQYGMALDNKIRESDLKFTYHGVDLVVDEISIEYVNGATIDYVEDNLMGSGFKIDNPNAVSSCGCGSSFNTSQSGASDASCGGGSCGCH
ncbi:MAG: hypothetical protein Fur0018_11340 [Anaerolineales bacterium]